MSFRLFCKGATNMNTVHLHTALLLVFCMCSGCYTPMVPLFAQSPGYCYIEYVPDTTDNHYFSFYVYTLHDRSGKNIRYEPDTGFATKGLPALRVRDMNPVSLVSSRTYVYHKGLQQAPSLSLNEFENKNAPMEYERPLFFAAMRLKVPVTDFECNTIYDITADDFSYVNGERTSYSRRKGNRLKVVMDTNNKLTVLSSSPSIPGDILKAFHAERASICTAEKFYVSKVLRNANTPGAKDASPTTNVAPQFPLEE